MAMQGQFATNRPSQGGQTAPKSEAGRRRPSQNARRHGLNSEPDAAEVHAMADLIFGGVWAPLGSDFHAAVLSLATAEVRRSNCIRHLKATEEAHAQPDPELDHFQRLFDDVIQDLPPEEARRGRRLLSNLMRTSQKSKADQHRLANRYLAEAEAQLSKARRRYAECLKSRNDPNFNYGDSLLCSELLTEFPLNLRADAGLATPEGLQPPNQIPQEAHVEGHREAEDEEEHPPARQKNRHNRGDRPDADREVRHQKYGKAIGARYSALNGGAIHGVAKKHEGNGNTKKNNEISGHDDTS